jgi:hypothetical protein
MLKSTPFFTLLFLVLVLFSAQELRAQSTEEDAEKFSFDVSLNSDQFFGFYPFFQGGYAVSDAVDFTFYGILWSGGTGAAWGNWTEFGVGVSLAAGDGLTINPQIGILNGNLLATGAAGPGLFAEGVVPNVTIGLDKNNIEGQIYAGYYTPLRNEVDATAGSTTTLSYLHYWINGGYKVSSFFSLGLHFEHLINSGGSNVEESTDVYQWFGPYVQFSKPGGGPFVRFSGGTDFVDGNDSFFKLTTGFGF